jgi:ATP-binding cassette subfamily F protein 3
MILLSVENVTKHFGPEPVLAGVTFEVRPGERISLVGPNGTGKTTLLKIIAGREEPDSGTVQRHSTARLGYLDQQPQFAPGRTVWDEAMEALSELTARVHEAEQLAHALAAADDPAEHRRLGLRYDQLHHELMLREGYHLDHKVERVLHGLGFGPETYRQPVEQLSGGQQNRLLMAKLLLEEPDLMLLDEPSNHLDMEATQWLEGFLCQSRSAVLVVSHDRFFLDRVAQRTLELFLGTVDSYTGNYSAYRRQKAERLEVQRRTYEKQQIEISKMEDFIRRNHYGQKHAQAEDRRKKLERIERVPLPREIVSPPMGFPAASRTGDVALRVEGLSKSYARPLFTNVSFDVLRGEKWGILGPNGAGKTTLLLCLLGISKPDAGRAVMGANVRVAYFDQQLAGFDEALPVLDAVRPDEREFAEQLRRDLLARFGITGDMVHQRVTSLSGGERNRVALARLSATEANFMFLDEPTNHLDLWSRGALESSLQKFDGTVLFVSHDRFFLNQVADHLLVLEDGKVRVIDGNYDTYLYSLRAAEDAVQNAPAEPAGALRNEPDRKSGEKAGRRKRRFPYRKVADLEAEIAECEQRIEELHAALGSADTFRDGDRVKRAMADLEDCKAALAGLYEHWEEAVELN